VKLSEVEASTDDIMNVAAFMLLFLSFACRGKSTVHANHYLKRSAEMAARLKLFGVPDAINMESISSLPREKQTALAAAAWGSFNTVM
jgi:hypothetical protein